MRNFKQVIVLSIFLGLAVTGCNSKKPAVITNTYKETVVETLHDTVFEIKSDSSAYKALLECQNGKVVAKAIVEVSAGKNVKAPKVSIIDNQLNVDCSVKAQELFAQWKSKQITKSETKQEPIYIEYQPTLLETFFIGFGQLCSLMLIIAFLIWIIKKQLTAYGLKK